MEDEHRVVEEQSLATDESGSQQHKLGADIAVPDDPVALVRSLCLSHADVTERLSHGEPTWFIKDKRSFVMFANHHHDGRIAFWCAAPPGAQAAFVAQDSSRYFVPPYVGYRGWLAVYLDVPVDETEIAEIVRDAYEQVAARFTSKRVVNSL